MTAGRSADGESPSAPANEDIRRAWRDLVERRLPAAARHRNQRWPICLDHCFARVLLDNACGRPWREAIRPPAWRNAEERVLREAISLGEAVLADQVDLRALNERSLEMRGKRDSRNWTPRARISLRQ